MKSCPHCRKPWKPMVNKIKIGDFVQLRPSEVLSQLKHLNENYLRPGEKELDEKDYNEYHFWLHAHVTKGMPIGTVIEYGAEDRHERGRLNLKVHFKHNEKTIYDILNEDDVRKVKNVPFKKR